LSSPSSTVPESLKKTGKGQIQQDYGYSRHSASRKLMDLEGSNIAKIFPPSTKPAFNFKKMHDMFSGFYAI
jgi:hypothetical protein